MFKKLFGGAEKEEKPIKQEQQILKPALEPFRGEVKRHKKKKTRENVEHLWFNVPGIQADHLVLTMCKQREVTIQVPDVYDGKSVKELRHSFCAHPDLKEVVIPEGVEVLGSGVFERCLKLTTVTLPSTLRRMATGAFVDCPQLKTLHWKPHPDFVSGRNAFHAMPSLFDDRGLLMLQGVLLATDPSKIGSTFVVPEEVEAVGGMALDGITQLDYLELSYTSLPFYQIQQASGVALPKVKVLVLRGTSSDKSLSAQYGFCCKPEKVVLWEGLSVIEEGALNQCESLTTISLPQSLKSIQDKAFSHCTKLSEITIPEGVETLGAMALDGIANLDHLELSYASLPFFHSQQTLGVALPKVKVLVLRGTSRDKSLSPQYSFCCKPERVELWEGLEVIEEGALKQCESLTTISLPQSLKLIQDKAFAHCTKLSEITIPKGVKRIESKVFEDCEALETIEFENEEDIELGLKSIAYIKSMLDVPKIVLESWSETVREAFFREQLTSWRHFSDKKKQKCREKLEDKLVKATLVGLFKKELEPVIYLENGGVPLCDAIFDGKDLDLIVYYLKLNVLTKKDHIDYLLDQSIQKEKTEVTAMLLEYKSNLFSPEELMAQEEREFEVEMGIAKPTRRELEKDWLVGEGKDGLVIRDYIGKGGEGVIPFLTEDGYMVLGMEGSDFLGLRSLIVERGVVRISGRFKDLETIHMGSGVSGFPADTFGMSALHSLKLPDTVVQLGRGFANRCMNLTEVELSPNIHTMYQDCFAHCKELQRVVFPEKLRQMDAGCFQGTKLKTLILPPSVAYIGTDAFRDCLELKEVFLPAGLQELGKNAFSRCLALKKIIIPTELTDLASWGRGSFSSCLQLEFVGYKGGKNLLPQLRKRGILG